MSKEEALYIPSQNPTALDNLGGFLFPYCNFKSPDLTHIYFWKIL